MLVRVPESPKLAWEEEFGRTGKTKLGCSKVGRFRDGGLGIEDAVGTEIGGRVTLLLEVLGKFGSEGISGN